jgi:hypothetical protein
MIRVTCPELGRAEQVLLTGCSVIKHESLESLP